MGSERRAVNESDHQKLVHALNMVIGVAMGERLDSIRNGTKELDTRLSTRIESVTKETTGALDSMRNAIKEMESKTAGSVAGMQKQRQEIEAKTAESIAAAQREATESMDKLQHSVLTRTAEMIGRLSKVEENQQRILQDLEGQAFNELEKQMQVRVLAVKNELERDVSGVRRELAALRGDLKEQMQATERVSAFLNSMASVFSVSPPQHQPQSLSQPEQPVVEPVTPSGKDPTSFVAPSQLTREEVDTAVERALGEDWSPGKTVEMPNPMFRGKRK